MSSCLQCILESKRYFLALFLGLGLLIVQSMRTELGIGIIKMTEYHKKYLNISELTSNQTKPFIRVREVAWSNVKVSLIEAAFFIGYTLFSVPGGFLSTVFSANIVFGSAVCISGFLNLFIPWLVHQNHKFYSVFIIRIMQGMAEGCLYPSVQAFWRFWAPKSERSLLISLSFLGMSLGPILGYPVCGILIKYYDWSTNFYFWGIFCLTWSFIWLLLSRKSPSQDRMMSKNERTYIENNSSQVKVSQVPWVSIMTSIPVWAIIIANIGRNWTYQFSFSGLPQFFKDKYLENSLDLGFQMSIPYIVMAILTPISGILADLMIQSGYSVTTTRKLFNTVGFALISINLIIVGFVPYLWLTTVLLCFVFGSFGITLSGFGSNHLDIGDLYAGVLMGLSNGIGTLAGVLSPILAMTLHNHFSTNQGWQLFFVFSGLLSAITMMFFLVFASGESQSWSKSKDEIDKMTDENYKQLKSLEK